MTDEGNTVYLIANTQPEWDRPVWERESFRVLAAFPNMRSAIPRWKHEGGSLCKADPKTGTPVRISEEEYEEATALSYELGRRKSWPKVSRV